MVRIAGVESGSIADELQLEIGTRIVRINGQRVRDGIDFAFLLGDPELAVEAVSPAGEHFVYEIERDPGTPIGVVPEPDTIRECANKCVFCFIDGNPKDARRSLWLRDDDFRLSFTYGSYVTLTNVGPRGLQRLVDQRISPLYVSVHATEPEVRERLLVNRRAGLIMEQLSQLLAGGLEVHTQVVLCPEWNDGAHLDRPSTTSGRWGRECALSRWFRWGSPSTTRTGRYAASPQPRPQPRSTRWSGRGHRPPGSGKPCGPTPPTRCS